MVKTYIEDGVVYVEINGQSYSAEAWEAGDGPDLIAADRRMVEYAIEERRKELE